MAQSPMVRIALYGVLGVAGYQLAQQGTLGATAKGWVQKHVQPAVAKVTGAVSGATGGTPASVASAPPVAQQTRTGGQDAANASTVPCSVFAAAHPELNIADDNEPWVDFFKQQHQGNPPCAAVNNGSVTPDDLYAFAVNAIGYILDTSWSSSSARSYYPLQGGGYEIRQA